MLRIAKSSAKDRNDLFRQSAVKMNVSEAIIEKDFWVCVVLHTLFHKNKFADSFVIFSVKPVFEI